MTRISGETALRLAWAIALFATLAVLFIGEVLGQTPTFFVNGKPLDPFGEPELRRLVAAEVAAAQG